MMNAKSKVYGRMIAAAEDLRAGGRIAQHWDDANGNPAGGVTSGNGYTVSWQNGPLNEGLNTRNGAFVEDLIQDAILRVVSADEDEDLIDGVGYTIDCVSVPLSLHILIVVDRLLYYQCGRFASDYNEQTLRHLALALVEGTQVEKVIHLTDALRSQRNRTLDRQKRGVGGTHQE